MNKTFPSLIGAINRNDTPMTFGAIQAACHALDASLAVNAAPADLLQAQADAARAREAAIAERHALGQQLAHLRSVANAGVVLIDAVAALRQVGRSSNSTILATYRKELQPMANELGCKIVLVGDRTAATLVLL